MAVAAARASSCRGEGNGSFVPPHAAGSDPVVYEELEHVRRELAELHERLDFTERMLAGRESVKELRP